MARVFQSFKASFMRVIPDLIHILQTYSPYQPGSSQLTAAFIKNANGLLSKLAELHDLADMLMLDVICMTETKLHSKHEVILLNYCIHRMDRLSDGRECTWWSGGLRPKVYQAADSIHLAHPTA